MLLFERADVLSKLLTESVFKIVWLYEAGFSTSNAVVGRITLQEGRLSMAFDYSYSKTFNAAREGLAAYLKHCPK